MEKGRANGNGRPARCVVAVLGNTAVQWIRSYFANGNSYPLVIAYRKGTIPDEVVSYCKSAAEFSGGALIELSRRCSERESLVKLACPGAWAYFDGNTEVSGCLDECFDLAERSEGFVLARFTAPDEIDNRHPNVAGGADICHTSPLFFHGEALERVADDMSKIDDRSLSDALNSLYVRYAQWYDGFCDCSIRKWAVDSEKYDRNAGNGRKFVCHSKKSAAAWAKDDGLPPAPFEEGYMGGSDSPDEGDSAVDAVFVIGTGSVDNNEELRYALRNIERNCKFVRDVYICGYCPDWVDKTVVKHLNWPDRFSHAKDANIIDKLRHACEHDGIAKRILFCSDDQFQTRECTWEDFWPRYLRKFSRDDRWYDDKRRVWHSRLKKTLIKDADRRRSCGLDESAVYYYQPHMWMQIDRDKFIQYARWCNYENKDDTIIASGYFNFIDADGRPDYDHVFLGSGETRLPDATHIAYHDGSYRAAIALLRKMFPKRSRFELPPNDVRVAREAQNDDAKCAIGAKIGEFDPRPATSEEFAEISAVSERVKDGHGWSDLMQDMSRAEELRLFGVPGWRVVWKDVARRLRLAEKGERSGEKMSESASEIVKAYATDPESLKTRRFGDLAAQARAPMPSFGRSMPRVAQDSVMSALRNRVRNSLRRWCK